MRELIGYLDACKGAGGADARTVAVIPQQFLCNQFLCKKLLRKDDRADHALIDRAMIDRDVIDRDVIDRDVIDALIKDEEWVGADIAIGRVPSVARTPTGNDLTDGILTERAWADRPRADSARNGSPI